MSDLKSRLGAAMRAAGFNQPQLARAASSPKAPVSQQVVQHLLSGRNRTSGHLPAIAAALGVSLDWLATGRHGKVTERRPEAVLTGVVGAGGEILRIADGPVLAGIEAPSGVNAPNVVKISGDALRPFQDGWLIFYGPECQGVSDEAIGRLCVIQVKDGPTLLKTLKPGSRKGLFRLESWNTPARPDIKIAWAAQVTDIRPQ